MKSLFDKFKLDHEKEALQTIVTNIENGVVFRGTNLWILIFAIFVASLGLNVNSTAVIIGAMLISPLMGPIMGIGLSMGINDVNLFRKALYNLLIATATALATSTIFFLISPLNVAHSEILARTSPTIYDVLIAFFGGLAGIIATASKQKGNVIPGVAIATALMPPLCTAGYGLATFEFKYFFGAFYLYIINAVFIALATLIMVRLLHFPSKDLHSQKKEIMAKRIVWILVILTLLPSIYFGYDLVQQTKFTKEANNFINNEAHFSNDYLLNKKVDAKAKSIQLVFGGNEIPPEEIAKLKAAASKYNLQNAEIDIKQGFAYLVKNNSDEDADKFNDIIAAKEKQAKELQDSLNAINEQQKLNAQLYTEIKAQYPKLKNAIIEPAKIYSDSTVTASYLILLNISNNISAIEKEKIENWLQARLRRNNVKLVIQKTVK